LTHTKFTNIVTRVTIVVFVNEFELRIYNRCISVNNFKNIDLFEKILTAFEAGQKNENNDVK
jgi:hypothetical protein